MNIKWLRRIEIGDQPWFTREETSKYTELMKDGKSRGFTWLIYAKSVITFPCPEKPVKGPGLYEIRGFAWSGKGRITHVDVSTDGGVNWERAQLQEPVLPKALTASRTNGAGTASRLCCNRAAWTRRASCSRRSPNCARCAASTASITTTRFRPGS